MKKPIFILTMALLNISNVLAQKITNEDDLKKFYIEYFSFDTIETEAQADSLIKAYCTKELYTEWDEVVNKIGLYDPLTNGFCDFETMKKTLVVKKETDCYIVSFNFTTWLDNKTETESVIIYVNAEGKISHTKRPEDGYLTPSK